MAKPRERYQSYVLVLIFGLLIVCVLVVEFLAYHQYETDFRQAVEQELSAVTAEKAQALAQYRDGLIAQAALFADNRAFAGLVAGYLHDPAAPAGELASWLRVALGGGYFDRAVLFDGAGQVKLGLPEGAADGTAALAAHLPEVTAAGCLTCTDFYRDQQGIYLAVLVPVYGDASLLGVLALRVDPAPYLAALMDSWPVARTTAETAVARLEGDSILLLRVEKAPGGPALSLSPADQDETVRRLVTGQSGVLTGAYLGQAQALATGQPVASSTWFVLASVTAGEALAPLTQMRWLIIVFTCVLLICVVATMAGAIMDMGEIRRKDRALQEKSAEMERFTYSVSHDLKSPLVTIRTFANYLTEDAGAQGNPAQLQKDVGYIQDAAERMRLLLDELLQMSRVGRVSTVVSEVAFNQLAREAVGAVAGRIAARGVAVDIREDPLVLTGDHARLAEVWQNLVDNAVKYMGDQPAPRITLGVEREGREAVFYVQDNGLGIAPRDQERIFDLFEKLDDASEGTGFGLALVKRIVELYHGRIWVESEGAGRGSTFRFTLPDAAPRK